MTNAQRHRGPDADAVWHEGPVALGHRRLSIIDLTEGANQPFIDYTGRYVLVFNGEIYNYRAIRQQLPNYRFQTNSDTEVIVAAYEQWGIDCLDRLGGMFAFAIWDRQTRELIVARDRLGKKPFYYYHTDEVFVFASEVRALLSTGLVPRHLDTATLPQYLIYQTISAPNTLVANVNQLGAGCYAILKNHQWIETTYWNLFTPAPADPAFLRDGKTMKRQICTLVRNAVEMRLVSDVPLGAFLSGGIDSSAVVALMAEQTEQPVNTFTVTFREGGFDESVYARQIAQRFNTRHTELPLSPGQLLTELPAILRSMDQPSGDGPNTYMVSKLTKQAGITVALSGLGGDELFAGYANFGRYARLQQLKWLWHFPQSVRQLVMQSLAVGSNPQKLADLVSLSTLDAEQVFPLLRQSISTPMARRLLSTGTLPNPYPELFRAQQTQLARLPKLSQLTISELLTYTEPLLLRDADQMSMAHALELRVPLLDYQLLEFMLHVPDCYKQTQYPKQLLVDSLHPLLPDTLAQRPKMGFSFPWAEWMRNELRTYCEERINRLCERGLFNADELRACFRQFIQCKAGVTWNQIWLLVVLEEWLENNNF